MKQELINAVENYVKLLPDLYVSPNDSDRLMMIAYQIVMDEENEDEEFKRCFVDILHRKFRDYSEDAILDFYQNRKEEIGNYVYVIDKMKTLNLVK